jgi:hypothetical protein
MTMPTEELSYDDTWQCHLVHDNPTIEIIDKNQRSSSARRLTTDGPKEGKDNLEYYSPNISITQIGISDAAPRLLHRNGMLARILHHMPRKVSKFVYDLLRKYRGRQLKYCDLTPEEFRNHFDVYCKRADKIGVKVFMIEICHGTPKVLKSSPHYNECVDIFNKQLRKVAEENENAFTIKVIEPSDLSDFQTDGYHLTASGQSKQYALIKDALYREGILN